MKKFERILERKLASNRILYLHILRINEEKIPKKILKMKAKENHPGSRLRSIWEKG
jgi:hypothetical protein